MGVSEKVFETAELDLQFFCVTLYDYINCACSMN